MSGPTDIAGAIAVAAALLVAALGVGRLSESWAPASFGAADRWALRLLLGAGSMGLAAWLVGQWAFGPASAAALLACGALTWLLSGPMRIPAPSSRPRHPFGWGTPVALAVLTLLAAASLAEPVGTMEHDGIAYHLLAPKVWLRVGHVVPVLDHANTSYPAVWESLDGLAMALGSTRAAGLLGVAATAALLLLTWGLVRSLGGGTGAATLAVALVATMPAAVGTADLYFVDVPYAALALLAARLAFDARDNRRALVLAGAALGFAMGTKYTGVPLTAVTCAVLWGARWREAGWRRAMGDTALTGAVALALGAPWYVRNWLVLGNPFYPHMGGGVAFPAASVRLLASFLTQRNQGVGTGPCDLFTLPWDFTFHAAFFRGAGGVGIGPLAFAPVGALVARLAPRAMAWGTWVALVTVVWFVTMKEARFLIHVVAVSAALAGIGGAALLAQPSRTGRALAFFAVLLSLGYGGAYLARARVGALSSLVSRQAADSRRRAQVPFAEAIAYVNAAPEARHVLLAHAEIPPFYMDKPYTKIRGPYGEFPVAGVRHFADVLPRLGALGITHVLDASTARAGFQVAPAPSLELVFSAPTARVYRVRPVPPIGPPTRPER